MEKNLAVCFAVALSLALNVLVGCAFIDAHITLRNSSAAGMATTQKKNNDICFKGLADHRTNKNIVGNVQNYAGKLTADVIADNNVPDWVNKEIEIRLEQHGYIVHRDCRSENPRLVIDGNILEVYTTAHMHYLGRVTIEVWVRPAGKKGIINKTYSGHEEAGSNWGQNYPYRIVLERALSSALEELLQDLDSLDLSLQE